MVVPVVAGLVALLVLGLHPPAELTSLLDRAVSVLRGVPPGHLALPAPWGTA
jgi:hypothetical protein